MVFKHFYPKALHFRELIFRDAIAGHLQRHRQRAVQQYYPFDDFLHLAHTDINQQALNSGNPVPYYNAHGYWKPFYPNHTSFEYFNLFPKYYCLGGLTLDPIAGGTTDELLCLNVTYPVNFNSCYFIQETAMAEEIAVTINSFPPVVTVLPNPSNQLGQGSITVSMPNWVDPVNLDCQSVPFRPSEHFNGPVTPSAFFSGEHLFISHAGDSWREVVILNSHGQIMRRFIPSDISSTSRLQLDCQGLPAGLYFILINDGSNRLTIKVLK